MEQQDSKEILQAKVVEIIVQQLHISPEQVTSAATLENLGADSLDRVELVMKFEEEFGLEIDDAAAEKLTTLVDVVAYIQDHKQ